LKSTWDEIDEKNRVWLIPAEHLKRGREHRIPLGDDAFAIIAGLDRGSPRLFPVGDDAMRKVCERIRDDVDVHGFRSTFADWAAFQGWPPHEVDEALGHQVGSKVSRAYRRTGDWLERRRLMLAQWADFCRHGITEAGDNIVRLRG
jgi:integrase